MDSMESLRRWLSFGILYSVSVRGMMLALVPQGIRNRDEVQAKEKKNRFVFLATCLQGFGISYCSHTSMMAFTDVQAHAISVHDAFFLKHYSKLILKGVLVIEYASFVDRLSLCSMYTRPLRFEMI